MQLESGTQQREEEAEMGAMPNFALQSAIDEYVDRMAAKLPELEERPLLEVCSHFRFYFIGSFNFSNTKFHLEKLKKYYFE